MASHKIIAIAILMMMFLGARVSRAQEFDELMGLDKKKTEPSYAIPVTALIIAPTPKSHVVPLVMDLIPLGIIAGVGSYCSIVKYDSTFEYTASDRRDCLYFLEGTGWVFMSLGTVPSHIYVRNKWYKVLGLSTIKALFFLGFSFLGEGKDYQRNNSDTSPEGYDGGAAFFKWGTLPALIITFPIYAYEMIDHQLFVKEFNKDLEERNQKTQAMITPLIWKDRVGLALQMSF